MIKRTKIRGSMPEVKLVEFNYNNGNIDTVYIRSNVVRIETEDFTGWEYDEIQYTIQEYMEVLQKENSELQGKNDILLAEILKMKL